MDGKAPDPNEWFCKVNAYISTTSGALEYMYNICFCFYLIFEIKETLKKNTCIK